MEPRCGTACRTPNPLRWSLPPRAFLQRCCHEAERPSSAARPPRHGAVELTWMGGHVLQAINAENVCVERAVFLPPAGTARLISVLLNSHMIVSNLESTAAGMRANEAHVHSIPQMREHQRPHRGQLIAGSQHVPSSAVSRHQANYPHTHTHTFHTHNTHTPRVRVRVRVVIPILHGSVAASPIATSEESERALKTRPGPPIAVRKPAR